MSEKKQGTFTLKLPKDREQTKFFNLQIKDIDEAAYTAASKFISAGKEVEAIKFLLGELYVGGDAAEIKEVLGNFVTIRSAAEPLISLLNPATGELKKN